MHIEHHPLIHDFPELRAELHDLRQADSEFARLADEYETLDKRICRVEEGIEVLADDALAVLKRERVDLKDQVAKRLAPPAAQCCGCCKG
ncbi:MULTISPECIES: YdcH family protein [unclassified Pseudomonas]|uniref:YdcH family protein n=1 Tax=unclassified Pseudomonas TaxID=196821 RepID=UPI001EDCE9BC|nr:MULTISPECIES: YdcH family protein [unclassified Pseudomonas]MCG4452128.1 YdcH family protein [Pseudomonas sp. MMS21 TM103]